MKKQYLCVTVLLILLSITTARSQEKPTIPINTVVERVQKFFNVYPIEKVHLHFDKPYYAVGDTLWFKSYLSHNYLEYLPSKITYVEVLNSKDSLIQTLRIPLENGAGNGYWVLDPSYVSQDNYRFRAYTKWMSNFSTDYFFNKVIPIGDAINKKLGTEISFEPNGNRTKANMQFRDAKGKLLGKRKVTWQAIDGWDAFDKGRGETDDMGRLSLNLSIKDQKLIESGRLIVNIETEKGATPLVGEFSLKNALWDADVQFFPEGGSLIAGLAKNLAFKAVGIDGRSLRIEGKIVDKKNNTVAEFSDLGLGMGYIPFLPLSGEQYKAVVKFENGKEKTYPLPDVEDEAINLILHQQDESQLQVAVVTNDTYFEKIKNQPYYILAQLNGHLVYAAQATMRNQSLIVNIPKENMPNGIIQLTLMSPDGTLVSERLAFLKTEGYLDIEIKTDKERYQRKDPVAMEILVKNGMDSIPGQYSISVIDETKVPYDDDQDMSILSNLLLTSDIAGYIEKPNYYFNEENENREEALDALLMTQGFRRFEYADLLAEKLPQINFLPEQGISLSGVLRLNTGRPVSNGGLLLSIPERALRKDTYTDQSGRFVFEDLVFPDSVKVTINARGNDNYRNLVINMDPTYFPGIDERNPYSSNSILNIDKNLDTYLDNSKNEFRTSILIDEVVVTGQVKQQVSSRDFSALSGLSMADHRIEANRLSGCNVLTMCLNTLLTGITYDNQTLKYYVSRNYNQGSRVPVQFFLDGMPIDEPSLNSIQVSDIEAIEIFLKDELGTVSRMYQNDGVVSIMTKKKDKQQPRMSLAEIESMLPKSNIIDMYPLGYIKERKFYLPKYDTPESKNTNDYRTTIYWNPDVKISGNEKTTFQFYNGDGNGKYKVVVEGMDAIGNVGRKIYYYEVN